MQTASKLLKELNAAGYLLEERECKNFPKNGLMLK